MAALTPRLSGRFWLCKAHGVDFPWFEPFPDQSNMDGTSAVPRQNAVFRQVTKKLPRGAVDRPVAEHQANKRVGRLSMRDLPLVEAGASYEFDLGYYDDGWWTRLDEAACRSLGSSPRTTRPKANTALQVIETLAVPEAADSIVSDRIGFLPERMAKDRRNPMAAAVRIQIAVALIAFVPIKQAHAAQSGIDRLTRFGRLIRATVAPCRQPTTARSARGAGA